MAYQGMKRSVGFAFATVVLTYFALVAAEAVALADSSLRPLTTDRPDLTESPFTVNQGHAQVESTLVGYAKSRTDSDGTREEEFEFATTNVRFGLTGRTEINLVWQPFGVVRSHRKGVAQETRDDGIGSVQIRAKTNLFGNDRFEQAGDVALALLPFISLPTDSDNGISTSDVEGGIIILFAVVLPENFGLGLNAGASAIKDEDDNDYDVELFLSLALAYEWTSRFGTYYEVAATLNAESRNEDIVVLGTGFTYALDGNTQLDGGVNFGLTDASDRWAPFAGLTRRF